MEVKLVVFKNINILWELMDEIFDIEDELYIVIKVFMYWCGFDGNKKLYIVMLGENRWKWFDC